METLIDILGWIMFGCICMAIVIAIIGWVSIFYHEFDTNDELPYHRQYKNGGE